MEIIHYFCLKISFILKMNLHTLRKSYTKYQLTEDMLPENPFDLFNDWFNYQVNSYPEKEATIMHLSTVNRQGEPRSRVMLLKSFSKQEGFTFFTNYKSQKGLSIAKNPNVCLSFFWEESQRQIIISGKAQKTTETDSINYFASRPTGSQISARISDQSQEIPSRNFLEYAYKNALHTSSKKPISKPKNWGGYCVRPTSFEFWQGRENRLHDRFLYSRKNTKWFYNRLAP